MNRNIIASAMTVLASAIFGSIAVFAQAQPASPVESLTTVHGKAHQEKGPDPQSAMTPTERMAWREIQERIDRMSHAEQAKDLAAAMHFMADDYTLFTLPDPGSTQGKIINKVQIAIYKKRNLDSLYSTSPQTHTAVESLSLKGNLATVVTFQNYVRVIRGGDGSPHEARTSVRHRETWIYTERGWLQKSVQELERGPIFLDGQPYTP